MLRHYDEIGLLKPQSIDQFTAYHALGVWMASNGYEMNGPTRAIYHKGPWCEKDPANYLTEIQAPVSKIK